MEKTGKMIPRLRCQRGLVNIGNSCYINATVQALFSAKPFNAMVRGACKSGEVCLQLANILKQITEEGPPLNLSVFETLIGKVEPVFLDNEQHDAEEFLSVLMNQIHEELKDYSCPTSDEVAEVAWAILVASDFSILRDVFGFMLSYITRCDLCGMTSIHTDPACNILAVPIPEDRVHLNLLDCLECLLGREDVEDYRCGACLITGGCCRQTTVVRPPKLLVMQLKRWYEIDDTVVHLVKDTYHADFLCVEEDISSYLLFYEKVHGVPGQLDDSDSTPLTTSPEGLPPDPGADDLLVDDAAAQVHSTTSSSRKRAQGHPSRRRRKDATINNIPEPTIAWIPDKFTPVYMKEEDVPGAKLQDKPVEDHSNDQLKRWLVCRGLVQTGNKEQLVARVKAAIQNNRLQLLDPAVDGGQWYAAKREAVFKEIPEACRPPILPIVGWREFPGVAVPGGFCRAVIENFLIERHPTLFLDDVDSDGELVAADSMSVGTKKPLKRGEQYRKSGHVTEVGDNTSGSHYFIRAIVLSSFHKDRVYRVFVTCSRSTAFIVEGFCECRQRALGRCSHVAALLLYVLDHVRNHGFEALTCTSRPQVWGQGTQKRKPGMIRTTDYSSRKSIKKKAYRDPRALHYIQRMTPKQRRNFLTVELQKMTGVEYGWETAMSPFYEDFPMDDEYCAFIGAKCCLFLENLQEKAAGEEFPCFQVTSGQSEDAQWADLRCWMITASRAKKLSSLTTPSAKEAYLLSELWRRDGSTIVTPAMEYGIATEPVARVAYLIEIRQEHPTATLIETGLWAMHQFPQLGCSPDGLTKYGSTETTLLEIKCPFVLKDKDPNQYDTSLDKAQLSRFFLTRDSAGNVLLKKNHEYYFQVQMCLGILQLNDCDLFVYSTHGQILVPVTFDSMFWEQLKGKLLEVHSTLILPEYFAMRTVRGLLPMTLPTRYLPVLYEPSTLQQ